MTYKIGIGGLHIESSTFTNYRSSEKDFIVRKDEELLKMYPWLSKYDKKIKFYPTLHARALPGGVVTRKFFDEFFKEMKVKLKELKKLDINGFLFDIHGAMSVEGLDDAEGYMIKEIRNILGYDVVISTTMDLHGNVSNLLFEETDLITCYRTAPHIDRLETRERAFINLIHILEKGRKGLVKAKVDVPILLSGEKTSTEVEPGKSLYKKIDDVLNDKNILDCSIWMSFPWADQIRSQAAVVLTGYDVKAVKKETLILAKYFWSIREDFKYVGPSLSVKNAVTKSLEATKKPFFISDTGDNPGAGGSGDVTILLKEFLKRNSKLKISKKVLFASIVDKVAIKTLLNYNVNDSLKLSIGGKIDPNISKPIKERFWIKNFFNHNIAGKCATLKIDNIDIIVTEKRYQYGTLKAFNDSKITKFSDYDIIVVKMGYLEPDLKKASKGWVMALSDGAVNQDLLSINYKNIKKDLYPFSKNFKPNLKPYVIKY